MRYLCRMEKKRIVIDIVSDLACPWCYIGKARLERALALEPDKYELEVNWKPFQLYPELPEEGSGFAEFMQDRHGSSQQAEEMCLQASESAKKEELDFRFDLIKRMPNTLEAHRLMLLANREDLQNALSEALFESYFTKGKDLSCKQTLAEIAKETGISEALISKFLNSDEGLEEVQYEELQYREAGIETVPSFIINNQFLIQGAQDPETFLQALEEVPAEGTI